MDPGGVVSDSHYPFDEWICQVKQCKVLPEADFKKLIKLVYGYLFEEPNVQTVASPATVCGNINGQFHELLELFETGGLLIMCTSLNSGQIEMTQTNYVFMGGYVNRGKNSVETLTYLMLLKAIYPSRVTLLRSKHETRQLTTVFGFYDEIQQKYNSIEVWQDCCRLFDCLPISAIIDGRIMCVSAGLSPEITHLDQIRQMKRNIEILDGPFADMMWSNPEESADGWQLAPGRGAYYIYGPKVIREFHHTNGLELLCRSHQLVHEGYMYAYGEEKSVVTIWSAPNFGGCGNVGAVLSLDKNLNRNFKIFGESVITKGLRQIDQQMKTQHCTKEE